MNPDFALLIFIAISILTMAIAKTHVAFVMLALCSGYVLSQFAGDSVFDFFSTWVSNSEFPLFEIVNILLVIAPAVLIGFRFRQTQTGIGRIVQQVVPAIALTLLAVVFLIDIMPPERTDSLRGESYLIGSFEDFGAIFVLFAVATAMFDVLVKHANEPVRKRRGPGRPKKR